MSTIFKKLAHSISIKEVLTWSKLLHFYNNPPLGGFVVKWSAESKLLFFRGDLKSTNIFLALRMQEIFVLGQVLVMSVSELLADANPPISTETILARHLAGFVLSVEMENEICVSFGGLEQAERCGQKITSEATIFSESVLKSYLKWILRRKLFTMS